MSTASDLIKEIRARGVSLWTEDGSIRAHGNVQALLPAELTQLRDRKPELVAYLAQTQTADDIPRLRGAAAGPLPLTATQTMPWHYTVEPRSRARTDAFAYRIRGELDITSLERSVVALCSRHEALRIKMSRSATGLTQHVEPTAMPALEMVDAPAQRLTDFLHHKIDYATDPLFSMRVIRLARDEFIVAASIDHIISDGVSIEILKRELWQLYTGQSAALPPLPIQFLDHVSWLQRSHASWLRTSGAYWIQRLADARPLQWPDPIAAPATDAPFLSRLATIDAELKGQLHELARAYRTLPSFVALTAYIATVLRWCGETELTVAVVDVGRYRPELANIVGCVAQHLHLRIQLRRGESFLALLRIVRDEFSAAAQHRDFDRVARILPGFEADIYFNWVPARTSHTVQGLELTPMPAPQDKMTSLSIERSLPFKAMLSCVENADQLIGGLRLSTQRFDHDAADQFARLFTACVKALCEDPTSHVIGDV